MKSLLLSSALVLMSTVSFAQSGPRPMSQEFKGHSVPANVKEAFNSCKTQLGIKMVKGQKPTTEQRNKMKACMEAKGVFPKQAPTPIKK